MIVSGGENVFPREVEDLLADHEAVVEVAVIGVEDEEFGQRLKAFVVLTRARRSPRTTEGPREGEPRLLQDAARGRVPRRAAAQRHRQGPQAGAPLARDPAIRLVSPFFPPASPRPASANCAFFRSRRVASPPAPVVGSAEWVRSAQPRQSAVISTGWERRPRDPWHRPPGPWMGPGRRAAAGRERGEGAERPRADAEDAEAPRREHARARRPFAGSATRAASGSPRSGSAGGRRRAAGREARDRAEQAFEQSGADRADRASSPRTRRAAGPTCRRP